jgi:hypothetical protein
LREHVKIVRKWHEKDLAGGYGEAPLPDALGRTYPAAGRQWGWQYLFPADKVALDPADGVVRRYHVYEKTVQAAISEPWILGAPQVGFFLDIRVPGSAIP